MALIQARKYTAKIVGALLPIAALGGVGFFTLSHGHSPERHHHSIPLARPGELPSVPLIGVREVNLPGSWNSVSEFASATRITPKIVLYYSDWRVPFRYGFAKTAAEHGAAVLVQMQPWTTSLGKIAAGYYDRYLTAYARSVKEFRRPVIIGFGHEMNGGWYPWGFGHESSVDFVAAWQHIVTLFRHVGATNATWLWTVSRSDAKNIQAYWPGPQYVTWVGVDGYYYQKNQDFVQVFGPVLKRIRRLTNDPILLAETAIGPIAGQAKYIPDLFAGISRYHLRGLVWFDVTQNDPPVHQNWRLEGNPAGLAAFRRAAIALEG